MFSLFFFTGNDPELAFDIKDRIARYIDEYVKEGEFDTYESAIDRMNNIGSRWIFYPNACIIEGEKVIGIYMEDGVNYTPKKIEEFVEV
jgi:hypothetical protein